MKQTKLIPNIKCSIRICWPVNIHAYFQYSAGKRMVHHPTTAIFLHKATETTHPLMNQWMCCMRANKLMYMCTQMQAYSGNGHRREYVCVCVCVCVYARERKRGRGTKKEVGVW